MIAFSAHRIVFVVLPPLSNTNGERQSTFLCPYCTFNDLYIECC
jgi:hypothetical protein